MTGDYYVARAPRILRNFDRQARRAQPVVARAFDEAVAADLVRQARRELQALLPTLPYIGGDDNPYTRLMLDTALSLAVYRALQARGVPVQEVGRLLYEMACALLAPYPGFLLRLQGRRRFTRRARAQARELAALSQQRRYPGDWVFSYVEGDGEAFDFGLDFTECAVCNVLRAQGAEELAPFLCLGDYPRSEAFGWGLVRTTTLAEGGDTCDFRLKWGRPTQTPPLPWSG